MIVKLPLFFSFFCWIGFSQQASLKGKVLIDSLTLSDVEVINKQLKTVTYTNSKGEFEILMEENNTIAFFKKGYVFHTVVVDSMLLQKNYIEIKLIKEERQIEEVIISNEKLFPKIKVEHQYQERKFTIPDGSIQNGVDFIAVFKLVGKLFKKEKEVRINRTPVSFLSFVNYNFKPDFLIKTLAIEEKKLNDFLMFCTYDERAQQLANNENVISMLEFLQEKAKEFLEKNN